MMTDSLLSSFLTRWAFTRSETIELLHQLDDVQLSFKPPGPAWQPLYYQFNCLGRTQLVYLDAVISGKMDFALFNSSSLPSKSEFQTITAIEEFLTQTDGQWLDAIAACPPNSSIEWPEEPKPLLIHAVGLLEHERLHHGQLISYFTLAGFRLPDNFKRNWAL